MNSRAKKSPESVTIKKAKNKGFIVTHHFNNMGSGESYQPPSEYAFGGHKEAMTHVHTTTAGMDGGPDVKSEDTAPADSKEARPAGVSGKAKAAPPTQRTKGAGVD